MNDFLADIAERSLITEQAIRPRPLSVFEPLSMKGSAGFVQQSLAEEDFQVFESNAPGIMSIAPDAMPAKELSMDQDESHIMTAEAPGLEKAASIAYQRHVPAKRGEQPARQDNLELEAPKLRAPVASSDPRSVAPIPTELPTGQYKHRPVKMQSRLDQAQPIGSNVLVDETISPEFETRERPSRKFPGGRQEERPSSLSTTGKGISRSGRDLGVPDYSSVIAGDESEKKVLVKPAIQRVEVERSVVTELPQHPIAPLHLGLERPWEKKNESAQKQPSTPTIQVTIGRIEVRAVTQSVSNRPKPKGKPPMSLDEYLRGRNGGSR